MAAGRKTKNVLKFNAPSKWWGSGWREALVSGSGVIGCSVLGGAASESVMITHSDLWWQGRVGVLPEVCQNIDKVRTLINEGRFAEADTVLPDALIAKQYHPQQSYPLPLCDLRINMQCGRPPKDYSRSVNMDTGEVTVSFRDGNTKYQRSLFVSREQDYIVMEITRTGAKAIDAELSLRLHERFNNRTREAYTNLPESATTKTDGKFMFFGARGDGGMDFGAVLHINYFGGTIVPEEDKIRVVGAEKVCLVIKPFINVKNREVKWKEIQGELKGFKNTYEKLLKEQVSASAKANGKAYLDLDGEDASVDTLVAEAGSGEVSPALLEKLWAYGRYLFTSAGTPSSAPVAPYGIWCGDFKGADSHLNADGSLQLCYQHALAGGLTDYLDALFAHYENAIDDLKKNAIRLFDCKGVMIPTVVAKGTGLLGQTSARAIYFTGAAGWLCNLMYDAYLYTGDGKLLKKILPFMKETAQFYTDFFQLQDDSFFESSPSHSPDSAPANADGVVAVKNALVDFAIARQLFENLVEGSVEAGTNKADIERWRTFLQHIPPYKLSPDGFVMEYQDSRLAENPKSGGTAMFYPVFPSSEVTDKSGEIFKHFEKTALRRFSYGSHQSSVSLARFANLFVRLGQTSAAEDIIATMVRFTAMGNLIFSRSDWSGMGVANSDIWATYTVESNLLLTNAIQDMFVQSDKDTIWVLPACNQNKGEIGGFLTRCGVEIDELSWDRRKGQISLRLKAKKARTVSLKFADSIKKYKGNGTVDPLTNTINGLDLPAGKIVTIEVKI